jgi:environmental stress-induced protein Ves
MQKHQETNEQQQSTTKVQLINQQINQFNTIINKSASKSTKKLQKPSTVIDKKATSHQQLIYINKNNIKISSDQNTTSTKINQNRQKLITNIININ